MQKVEIVIIDKGRPDTPIAGKDWEWDQKEIEITMVLDGKFRARCIATREKEVFRCIEQLWMKVFPNLIKSQ